MSRSRAAAEAAPRRRPQPVEPMRFRYMGPAPAGRIAVGRRHSRRSDDLLPRQRIGRRLEIHRQRRHVRARLRRPARAGDWRAGAVAPSDPQSGLGGHRRRLGDPAERRRWATASTNPTDAGATWTNMGLRRHGPHRPRHRASDQSATSSTCAPSARATGPQQERGVFKTTDGGTTWNASLFVNARHRMLRPVDRRRTTRTRCSPARGSSCSTPGQQYSGGPGSGVYITHDGGTKWTKIESRHAAVAGRQDRRRDRAVRSRGACTR